MGLIMLLIAASVVAALGVYDLLYNAQGGIWLLLCALAASIPVYVLCFNQFFHWVKERTADPNPLFASNEAKGRVWLLSLLVSLLLFEAIVYGYPFQEHAVLGKVSKKLERKNKYGHSWRIVIDKDLYFYIPYAEGVSVSPGDRVGVTYRDAVLGVRFIKSYKLAQ